ncbi:MAG: insulinase family protein [Mariprofundaceae bacterium]|nr:insulinase family protein [Mariprofundaceae bacterium]
MPEKPETMAAFAFQRSTRIDTLNVVLQEFVHAKTGAVHIHLATDDPQNAFLVGFRTVPEDSTGVAHILEHTALCGSRKFPVRDPFFMMTRRSLNTFMNAFTSSDWTAYPFASCNKKDFNNLLQVYLDAAFFPCLEKLDFLQEGHRFEFETMDDSSTPLMYKGVVFNEMKGAMSSPVSALWQALTTHLFPTQTYHYNSGGDPVDIPHLTHAQLKAFHATHYHPTNAVFMTYGNITAATHQAVFEQHVLKEFTRLEQRIRVGKEQRFDCPQYATTTYAVAEEQGIKNKTHIVLAWLLDASTDAETVLMAHLLSSVLLANSASPLRYALETSDLGEAPSPLCGLQDSTLEMVFCCGFEGSNADSADAIEQYILETLRRIATDGVPQEQVNAVLHQLELSQREVGGDHFPYGLGLMVQALSPALYDAPVAPMLDVDPILLRLRERVQQQGFIQGLVQDLLNNQHRVRLVMLADATQAVREQDDEVARLASIKAGLSDQQKEIIIDEAKALKARQESADNPEILPKVTRDDIPHEFPLPKGKSSTLAAMPATSYECATNGLVYAELIVPLPAMDEQSLAMLPFFAQVVDELGCAGRDYLATQALQASVTGGIGAHVSVQASINDHEHWHSYYTVSGKALQRNQEPLMNLMMETLEQVRFDESTRLKELVSQFRLRSERSVVNRGHTLAMRAASASFNPIARLQHAWSGLAGIQWLKALDKSLEQDDGMGQMQKTLCQIQKVMCTAPRQILLLAEPQNLTKLQQQAAKSWHSKLSFDHTVTEFSVPSPQKTNTCQAWVTTTQVNFCARAYPAVASNHADAAALHVLGSFLRNNFLHRTIREQGGAYGGGAGYDANVGAFRFYSYRDPRLQATLDDFDDAIDWLLTNTHDERLLEEAVLGIIGSMDAPGSPAGEASSTHHRTLRGRTPEQRRAYRQRILHVTLDDLTTVAKRWLQAEYAHTAIITNQSSAESLKTSMDIIQL